jgi:NitT/TauT family transport system substrate-binding protein
MRSPLRAPIAAAAIASVLTMTLASACSSSSSTSASTTKLEKTNLVVGTVPAEAILPIYVAEDRGIFAAHGLHVKLETIVSTAQTVPDLEHGTFDVAAGQLTTWIAAQAEGLGQFRVLAPGVEIGPNVNEIMALKSSGITSPADLKGKTIAVNALSGDGVLLTDALLAAYGIQPNQVTLTAMGFPDMAAALQAHRVAAVYMTQPYDTEVSQQLGATVVADLNEGAAQGMLLGGFAVTAAWAAKYPHTAAAFTASIEEASQVTDTNLAAAQKAAETWMKATPKVADVMAFGNAPTTVPLEKLNQLADLMHEFGELKSANFDATVLVSKP